MSESYTTNEQSGDENTPYFDDSYYPDSLACQEQDLFMAYQEQVNRLHAKYVRVTPAAGYIYIAWLYGVPISREAITVKIGKSRNPKTRASQLNKFPVVMPIEIHMTHSFFAQDATATELLIHRTLDRYRQQGEWFVLPQEIEEGLGMIWYAEDWDNGITFKHLIDGERRSLMDHITKEVDDFRAMTARREAAEQ